MTSSQVDASGHGTSVVVFEQEGNSIEVGRDLLDFGPKNELYLAKGQIVTFTLATKAQIGLKALNDDVKYVIRSDEATITSSTDMFTKTYDAGSVTITQIKAVKDNPTAAAQANTLALLCVLSDTFRRRRIRQCRAQRRGIAAFWYQIFPRLTAACPCPLRTRGSRFAGRWRQSARYGRPCAPAGAEHGCGGSP